MAFPANSRAAEGDGGAEPAAPGQIPVLVADVRLSSARHVLWVICVQKGQYGMFP